METKTIYRIHLSKYYSDIIIDKYYEIEDYFIVKREEYKEKLDKRLMSLENYNYWIRLLDNAVITKEKIVSEILDFNTKVNEKL